MAEGGEVNLSLEDMAEVSIDERREGSENRTREARLYTGGMGVIEKLSVLVDEHERADLVEWLVGRGGDIVKDSVHEDMREAKISENKMHDPERVLTFLVEKENEIRNKKADSSPNSLRITVGYDEDGEQLGGMTNLDEQIVNMNTADELNPIDYDYATELLGVFRRSLESDSLEENDGEAQEPVLTAMEIAFQKAGEREKKDKGVVDAESSEVKKLAQEKILKVWRHVKDTGNTPTVTLENEGLKFEVDGLDSFQMKYMDFARSLPDDQSGVLLGGLFEKSGGSVVPSADQKKWAQGLLDLTIGDRDDLEIEDGGKYIKLPVVEVKTDGVRKTEKMSWQRNVMRKLLRSEDRIDMEGEFDLRVDLWRDKPSLTLIYKERDDEGMVVMGDSGPNIKRVFMPLSDYAVEMGWDLLGGDDGIVDLTSHSDHKKRKVYHWDDKNRARNFLRKSLLKSLDLPEGVTREHMPISVVRKSFKQKKRG